MDYYPNPPKPYYPNPFCPNPPSDYYPSPYYPNPGYPSAYYPKPCCPSPGWPNWLWPSCPLSSERKSKTISVSNFDISYEKSYHFCLYTDEQGLYYFRPMVLLLL